MRYKWILILHSIVQVTAEHQVTACPRIYFRDFLAWVANTIFFAETYSRSIEMSSNIVKFFQLHEQNRTWGWH